ncbi:hypothetical protein [Paenibacillus dendritiformis]|uniref:hypothetical protein n=1 Tax=Paenibacillus dendritiformis TaxID=130049 RepID=UPI001F54CFCB|nr:hypothetical protein [Paenibacillus dendritiformis]
MKLYELVTPKTKGSIRTIDIDESVMKLLKEFQERQNKIMAEAKKLTPDFHDANFVFCREKRIPIRSEERLNTDGKAA